jgi:YD repeat-containing protein
MTDTSGTTTWGYDALYRLTSATYPYADVIGYGYDAVGNRTSLTVNGVGTTNTYDNGDRMTASGSDTYSYNNNGNLTSKTLGGVTTNYTYDQLNRLTALSGSVTASYIYNGANLRVAKTTGGVTTNYTWDQTGLGTVVGDGNEYVWGAGLISRVTVANVTTYAHSDGLGSIRLLTDATGASVGTQAYDAFGATRAQTGELLSFTYTGEQVDPESGLVYPRARYVGRQPAVRRGRYRCHRAHRRSAARATVSPSPRL